VHRAVVAVHSQIVVPRQPQHVLPSDPGEGKPAPERRTVHPTPTPSAFQLGDQPPPAGIQILRAPRRQHAAEANLE
jgi:hypothetical protein